MIVPIDEDIGRTQRRGARARVYGGVVVRAHNAEESFHQSLHILRDGLYFERACRCTIISRVEGFSH